MKVTDYRLIDKTIICPNCQEEQLWPYYWLEDNSDIMICGFCDNEFCPPLISGDGWTVANV